MFDYGNIQSIPTPEMYRRRGLATRTWNEGGRLSANLSGADYEMVTLYGSATTPEVATLSAALSAAEYFEVIINGSASPVESAQMSAALSWADYLSAIYAGGERVDAGQISVALASADYEQVIVNSSASPVEPATLSASLSGANYGAVFSAEAQNYFDRLDAAGLRVTSYDAANAALIDRLVGNGGNLWPASGAFCAMAGYLYPGNGANLIPLKDGHNAGTLFNFVTGDWNAVTGLVGDGSTKYANSNFADNSMGRDNRAIGAWHSTLTLSTTERHSIGVRTGTVRTRLGMRYDSLGEEADFYFLANSVNGAAVRTPSSFTPTAVYDPGYLCNTRTSSTTSFGYHNASKIDTGAASNADPETINHYVFAVNNSGTSAGLSDARIPFYHLGPGLSDSEVTEMRAALAEWVAALAAA